MCGLCDLSIDRSIDIDETLSLVFISYASLKLNSRSNVKHVRFGILIDFKSRFKIQIFVLSF